VSLFAQVLRDLRRQGGDPAYIDVRVMDRPVWMPRGSEAAAADGAAPGSAAAAPVKAKPASAAGGKPAGSRAATGRSTAPARAAAGRPPPAKAAGKQSSAHHPQKPTGDNAVQ
jgi:hypothetical protein